MQTAYRNKIYFASDFHLGTPSWEASIEREKIIVEWLDTIKQDAAELYLVGDIFDFWFEYKTTVPKGFIRFLGKLAELNDLGIKIILFKGNHDMWLFDYFKHELNAEIISNEKVIERNGKKFYIHHGDGLGAGDFSYKLLKKVFRSTICQFLFSLIHPDIGISIAHYWSKSSRKRNAEEKYLKIDKEWLVRYSEEILKREHFDYLIYGHRHLPLDLELSPQSRYINLGEWLYSYSYAVFDGENVVLNYFKTKNKQQYFKE